MSMRRGGIWKGGLGLLTALAVLVPAGSASAATCDPVNDMCGFDFSVRVDVEFDGIIGTTFGIYDATVPVDWGDGSPEDQATVSDRKVSGKHTYKSPGVYTVTIYGGEGDATAEATVMPALCDGQVPTIYRGSGHPGTSGANGTPMNLTGTSGADVIVGDSGKDTLRGGGGNDTICGAAGSDTIFDNDGADKVFGEGAKDVLFAGHGADTYSGGDGTDAVSYRLRNTPVFASLGGTLGDGALNEGDTIGVDVENLLGGSSDDLLTGDGGPNLIRGGAGSDDIKGLGGNDTLSDGPGDDTSVDGGDDNDTLIAGTGNDAMSGGAGRDHVTYAGRSDGVSASFSTTPPPGFEDTFSQEDVEKLTGSQGADMLRGSDNADTIYGEGGADDIDSYGGNDTLLDGPGTDQVDGGSGNDTFYPGAGADEFAGGGDTDIVSYRFRTESINALVGVAIGSGAKVPPEGDTINGDVENLGGGSASDLLDGDGDRNVIWGNAGDDTLRGFGGDDVLLGNDGNDRLEAGDGPDDLFGGDGDDQHVMFPPDSSVDQAFCGGGNDEGAESGGDGDTHAGDCENITTLP